MEFDLKYESSKLLNTDYSLKVGEMLKSLTRFPLAMGLAVMVIASATAQSPKKLTEVEGITEYGLDNGARVLLYPDKSSGTVTVAMTVMVGSRHEGYGETGMAHLLEHLLFKGSPKHKDIPKEMKDRGASFNGTTWYDRTNYYETVPATDENLEWALDLEADRLVNSYVRGEDLASEMTVVRNEFEIGENNPSRILFQRVMATAYEWHNYGKSTIGNRIDLERVPIQNLKRFYKKFYQPDNIVLVVAGKFDSKKALELIQKKFGSIPKPDRKLDKTYTEEPPQDGERTVVLRRNGDVAVVGAAYHIPAAAHEDYAACQILSEVLSDQPGGILYKDLVEKKIASTTSSMEIAGFDPGMIICNAQVPKDGKPEVTRDALIKSIMSASERITADDVKRNVKKVLKNRENLQTNTQRFAIELSEWSAYGDWRLFFLHRDRLEKVKVDDVKKAAKKYLVRSNQTVGMFIPTKKPVRATVPSRPNIKKLIAGYKGRKKLAEGEQLGTTPAAIEARITRGKISPSFKYALLPKESRGDVVRMSLTLRYGNEKTLNKDNRGDAENFLGAIWTRGTDSRDYQAIRDRLNELKANLGARSGSGQVTFSIRAKRDTFGDVLDLLAEILRKPTFPEKEFDIVKKAMLTGMEQQKSSPQALAFTAMQRKLSPFPKGTYRYVPTIEETIERVEAVTIDKVRSFYKEFLGGTHGEVTIVGDFDSDAALDKVKSMLADWKSDIVYERIKRPAPKGVKGENITINTPDKKNAIYVAGRPLEVQDTDDDFEAISVGNNILGGGALSNRLANRVRQKDGLSYSVQSLIQASPKEKNGAFIALAMANPKNRDKLVAAMEDEMVRLVESGVKEDELEKAKQGMLQSLKRQRTSDGGLLSMIHSQLNNDRTMDFVAKREAKIKGLTKDQVDKAIKKIVKVKDLIVITAGDFEGNSADDKK